MDNFLKSGAQTSKNIKLLKREIIIGTLLRLIKNLNKTNFEQISKARNIEISKLESLVNSGATILMNPDTALKYGFLDNKLSYEELVDSISKNKDFQSISIYNYNELQRKKEKVEPPPPLLLLLNPMYI